MEYYWYIKRIKDDTIKVSPKVGLKAQEAWLGGAERLNLPGDIAINCSTISAIEPSTEPYKKDNPYLLGDGKPGEKKKSEPILNTDGEVITNWYKKNVGSTAWEKHYAALPAYFKLVDSDGSVWVALRIPEETNRELSKELVLVQDEKELNYLWNSWESRYASH
jgi:hypothetical protein